MKKPTPEELADPFIMDKEHPEKLIDGFERGKKKIWLWTQQRKYKRKIGLIGKKHEKMRLKPTKHLITEIKPMKAIPPSQAASGNYDKEAYKAEFIARKQRLSTNKEETKMARRPLVKSESVKTTLKQRVALWKHTEPGEYKEVSELYTEYMQESLDEGTTPVHILYFRNQLRESRARQRAEEELLTQQSIAESLNILINK